MSCNDQIIAKTCSKCKTTYQLKATDALAIEMAECQFTCKKCRLRGPRPPSEEKLNSDEPDEIRE